MSADPAGDPRWQRVKQLFGDALEQPAPARAAWLAAAAGDAPELAAEVAETLDVAPITVKRDWALARAWLFRELQRQAP